MPSFCCTSGLTTGSVAALPIDPAVGGASASPALPGPNLGRRCCCVILYGLRRSLMPRRLDPAASNRIRLIGSRSLRRLPRPPPCLPPERLHSVWDSRFRIFPNGRRTGPCPRSPPEERGDPVGDRKSTR